MVDSSTISKGDIYIIHGTANVVFQIKDQENFDGDTEPFVFYRPYYHEDTDHDLFHTIPKRNFSRIRPRRPMKKSDLDLLFSDLLEPETFLEPVDTSYNVNHLNINYLSEKFKLIKQLWLEKITTQPFPNQKSTLLEKIIANVSQEIALILETTPQKAEAKLNTHLKKLR